MFICDWTDSVFDIFFDRTLFRFSILRKSVFPPNIQLIGVVYPYPSVFKQSRQRAMDDRRPNLALDVIADDRYVLLCEALCPPFFGGDKHGNAIDKADTCFKTCLGIIRRRLFRSNRQVAEENISAGLRSKPSPRRRIFFFAIINLRFSG